MSCKRGVGSTIAARFKKYGIRANEGCSCFALAKEMDALGPDGCEERLEYLIVEMRKSIAKWKQASGGGWKLLPTPPDIVLRELIVSAIKEVRSNQ